MILDLFPKEIRPFIIPKAAGELYYKCLGCSAEHSIDKLLYVCPECNEVLLIEDRNEKDLHKIPGTTWQQIFDFRKMLKIPALKGIYRYMNFLDRVSLWSLLSILEKAIPLLLKPMKT